MKILLDFTGMDAQLFVEESTGKVKYQDRATAGTYKNWLKKYRHTFYSFLPYLSENSAFTAISVYLILRYL